ncbi:MAG: hypothetical protein ACR2F0_01225, partial [Chthoniobacterales bacterium]
MADSEKVLKILVQVRSDMADLQKVVAGLKDTRGAVEDTKQSAFGLTEAFKFAGAEEIIHRFVETLKEIPAQFVEAIKHGVEFNSELQRTELTIAGILRQTQGSIFPDFKSAREEASITVELLKAKAQETGTLYQAMFENFTSSARAMSNAGIADTQKQIDLISKLTQAMQGLGIQSFQATRDIQDLFAGITNTKGARELGITSDALKAAEDQGKLYEFLSEKIRGSAEAGKFAAQTFSADVNRMKNDFLDLSGVLATPFMEPLTEAVHKFNEAMKDPSVAENVRALGSFTSAIAQGWVAISQGTSVALAKLDEYLSSFAIVKLLQNNPLADAARQAQAEQFLDTEGKHLLVIRDEITHARTLAETEAARAKLTAEVTSLFERANRSQGAMHDIAVQMIQASAILVNNFGQLAGSAEQAHGSMRATADEVERAIKASQALKTAALEIAILRAKARGDDHEAQRLGLEKIQNDERAKLLKEGASPLEAERQATALVEAKRAEMEHQNSIKTSAREIRDLERETAAALRDNRLQQELITQDPSLSPDEKTRRLIPLLVQERAELAKSLEAWKAYLAAQKGSDPQSLANIQRAIDKIKEIGGEYKKLGFTVQQLGGGVGAELKQWTDSFGTSAHQIAQTIEGTINAALQGTNQLLTDAIFGTGDWRQTLVGVEKQILNLFLTWIEQMALQKVAQIAGIGATTTTQVASGGAIAAAHAPAAAATSISSYGAAAIVGEVLAVAAIAAIIAALAGGFEGGGFTGGRRGKAAGVVHGEEFVFSAHAVDRIGRGPLEAMHHYAAGGRVQTDDPFGGFTERPLASPSHYLYANSGGAQYATRSGGGDSLGDANSSAELPEANGPQVIIGRGGNVVRIGNRSAFGSAGFAPFGGASGSAGFNPFFAGGNASFGGPYGGGGVSAGGGGSTVSPGFVHVSDYGWIPMGGGQYVRYNTVTGGFDHTSFGPSIGGNLQLAGYGGPTPINVSLGAGIPDSGPWSYGGTDAPVGSIVGVTASGQTVIQGPNGERIVGGVATTTGSGAGGGVSAYQRASDAATAAQTGLRDAEDMAWERFSRPDQIGYTGDNPLGGSAGPSVRLTPAQVAANDAAVTAYGNILGHTTASVLAWYQAHPTLAEQQAILGGIWPGHAAGGRIAGAPSQTDNVLAWMATGEGVVRTSAMEMADRTFGPHWLDDLNNMRVPVPRVHLAAGGRVSGGGGSNSGGGRERPIIHEHIIVADLDAAIDRRMHSTAHIKTIVHAMDTY